VTVACFTYIHVNKQAEKENSVMLSLIMNAHKYEKYNSDDDNDEFSES